MRITSNMLQMSALRSIRANLKQLNEATNQALTGRRVRTVSDDPVSASQIMRMGSFIRDVERFRRNAAAAGTRLATEDNVLTTVQKLVSRAKDLAASAASDDPTDPFRQTALTEIKQIREQIIALGNTKIGNEYIFGGGQTTTPPFLADGTYVGDGTIRQAELDTEFMIDTNHTGDQIFSSALSAVDSLETELATGTAATISATFTVLDGAHRDLLARQTEIGFRLATIDDMGANLNRRSDLLLDRMVEVRDADMNEVLFRVTATQSALERAFTVLGRVLNADLTSRLF